MRLVPEIRALIRLAVREDLHPGGDRTTRLTLPAGIRLRAVITAKEPGVICGLSVAREVFRRVAPRARFTALVPEGAAVRRGRTVARVEGPAGILAAERTALNFLQRLSGIATLTRAYADRLRGTRARLYDTRKTTPGWRLLEKHAVRCGGGMNHRMGLGTAVMVKDNHWAAAGDPRALVERLKRRRGAPLIVEAKDRRQAELALSCGPDVLLLDNMSPARLRAEIRRIRRLRPRALVEVSGGVSLSNIRAIARLGPDRISVGRITHSAPALDLSLEVES